ncbi:MAG: hypothetical protein FXF47_00180 [Candidatus Mcinerneyibacterium aminivorans]|uniref:Uncharacterized protein n=1 Tax=Candidatus Mcinerneyibacterium aminivorans TaxID=2703815 RepID=A0A5D0ML74_9BACT|nr:MAG: hypothetical protein FXF47_00180 [Candidatus Mcinerneyibacterium aminivorans]
MNKQGKSYILLDIIIVILLAAVIISFILPSRQIDKDLKAITNTEKALSALSAGIDMYYTRMDGEMPGEKGEGIEAIYSIFEDLKEEEIWKILEVNPDKLKNYFAKGVPGTKYEPAKGRQAYEIVAFSKDRAPHKFIMDEEEIKNIDPEKKLVEILGQIEGLNKDIKNKIKKFKLIQSRGEDIEKFIANAKEYEKILAEDDLFTNLEENLENAESVDDVNKKLYNKIRNTLNNLRVSIKKVEKVKENSKETVRSIGKIAIDAEDYMKELEEIKNYVKSDRLKGMAKEFLQKAEKTKDRADDVTDKLYPQAEELAKKVDEKSDFLEEYNGKYLEYRNKFQPLNNMYADMQNENEE